MAIGEFSEIFNFDFFVFVVPVTLCFCMIVELRRLLNEESGWLSSVFTLSGVLFEFFL